MKTAKTKEDVAKGMQDMYGVSAEYFDKELRDFLSALGEFVESYSMGVSSRVFPLVNAKDEQDRKEKAFNFEVNVITNGLLEYAVSTEINILTDAGYAKDHVTKLIREAVARKMANHTGDDLGHMFHYPEEEKTEVTDA